MHNLRISLTCALLCALQCLGLGINCRGSGVCPLATFDRSSSTPLLEGLRFGIWDSTLDNGTTYNSGDHVICVSSTLSIAVGASVGYDGVSTSLSVNGQLGSGGICAFPQNLASPLSLGTIKVLADALLEHECTTCGSIPVHYVDENDNDPSEGILTFNYVADPVCIDNCISEQDGNEGSSIAPASPTISGSFSNSTIASSSSSQITTTSTSMTSDESSGSTILSSQTTSTSTTSDESSGSTTINSATATSSDLVSTPTLAASSSSSVLPSTAGQPRAFNVGCLWTIGMVVDFGLVCCSM